MGEQITMSSGEQALAIEQIRRVFAARLRALDEKRWDVYPTLHTDDVVSETWGGLPEDKQPQTGGASNRVVGPEALTAAIRGMLGGPTHVTTVHHGHAPEITLTSDTTATGIWPMEDRLWWTNERGEEEYLHGFGHYHEEYRLQDGRWLISYRSLTRLRVDQSPGFFDYMQSL